MTDPKSINPYAPVVLENEIPLDVAGAAAASLPQTGIPFAGVIDVRSIGKIDYFKLLMGLGLGFTLACVMFAGAAAAIFDPPASGGGAGILLVAGLFTFFSMWSFAGGQTRKPLGRFPWMSGEIAGVLWRDRIDIQWSAGNASLMIPKSTSIHEFTNRRGRLFLCRGVGCYVPSDSVDTGAWRQIMAHAVKGQLKQTPGPPPPPTAGANVWNSDPRRMCEDYERHRFVTAAPVLSRFVCLFSCATLVAIYLTSPGKIALGIEAGLMTLALASGTIWLAREGLRRHWPIRDFRFRSLIRSASTSPPGFQRWIDDRQVMVGYSDGWIRLPWRAFAVAVLSRHGIELRLDTAGADVWFLERGGRDDDEWFDMLDRIRTRVPKTRIYGSIRKAVRLPRQSGPAGS